MESINVTLTPFVVVWRIQGDITDGVLTNTVLELLLKRLWKDENGVVYKEEALPTVRGTPLELGLQPEFLSAQQKLEQMVLNMF